MNERHTGRLHRWGKAAFGLVLLCFGCGVLLLWGWNTVATELFQAPAIAFRHALAFEALVAALTVPALLALRRRAT